MAIEASIGTAQDTSCDPSPPNNPAFDVRNQPAALRTVVEECQPLLQERLTPSLLASFQRLTGLAVHLVWAPPRGPGEPGIALEASCPSVNDQIKVDPSAAAQCLECMEQSWPGPQVVKSSWFTGRCGARTLTIAIAVADAPVLRMVVQIPPEQTAASETPKSPPFKAQLEQRSADAQALLQLVAHDLEMTLQAHLLARQLRLGTASPTRTQEPAIRQEILSRRPVGPHAQQVVQAMLDYVRDHYQRPMALKEVAAAFGMNANYLSGLFHKATGTAFHRYVHAVRMSKAEVLLRDPRMRICDVASAVGYASPNHFRNAFKACEKLSPKAWLERQEAGRHPSWPGPWDQDWVEI